VSDTIVKADLINDLKTKIKAEMQRRKGYGDISAYGGTAYDFTNAASVDKPVLAEHGEKTINIMYAVKDIDVTQAASGKLLPENAPTLTTLIGKMSTESMEGSTSSCRGACAGLCAGSCIGGCNGCSGGCNAGCQGCTASCGSSCASGLMYA
jgi:hypothetical protein